MPDLVETPKQHATFATDIGQNLLAKVKNLQPLLRSEARQGELNRSMTDVVYKALDELNIWWMLLPRRWGGMGFSTEAESRVLREISKGDPAVAWVVQIINGTSWISSMTPDALQEELFGDGPVRICSSFAIAGSAKQVDGGYIIDGLWPYNSGSRQSDWGQYLVNLEHSDGSVTPGHFAYVKMQDVEIVDTWYCAGLQGTSSDSTRITQHFIPEHYMLRAEKPAGAHLDQHHIGEPSDYLPVIPTIRSVGMNLLVGAAEGALEMALETAHQRSIPNSLYKKQSHSQVTQRNLGEAASKINAARLLAQEATSLLDQCALQGQPPTISQRALTKANAASVVKLLLQALDSIMSCAGSSAFLLDNPLQRHWRDINVAARHAIYNPEIAYEVYGCDLLGNEQNSVIPALI